MSRCVYSFIDGLGTFADAIYLDELSLIGETSEVGSKVETIYTIESAEDNQTYLERITDNLSKIYDSLSEQSK